MRYRRQSSGVKVTVGYNRCKIGRQAGTIFKRRLFERSIGRILMTRILANVMRIIERGDQEERLFGIATQEGNTCLGKTEIIMPVQVLETESLLRRQGIGMRVPFPGICAFVSAFFQ